MKRWIRHTPIRTRGIIVTQAQRLLYMGFLLISAPPPVTLQTKLNTTFLSLNEVGQHSVDIHLKSGLGDVGNEVIADDDVA